MNFINEPQPKKSGWVVAWTYNGNTYSVSYESRTLAELKMIQLESWGFKPTLHQE